MRKLIELLEGNLKYLIASVLLAVPLYPKFPFVRVPGTYVSIRLEDLLLAFSAIVLLVLFIKHKQTLFNKGLERAIVLFLAAGFISLLSAIFLTQTAVPSIGILHWARRVEYFIPFFLGIYIFKLNRGSGMVEFLTKLVLIVVILAFIYGVGQRYLNWPVIITQNLEYSKGVALRWIPGSHINSTFAGHYDLATFLVLVLPVFVNIFFTIKERIWKMILLFAVAAGIWLLINAISRISIVSYLLSVAFGLFLLKKYKQIVLVVGASLIIFALSGSLISRYVRIFEVAGRELKKIIYVQPIRVASAVEGIPQRRDVSSPTPSPAPVFEDRSTSIRLNVEWPRAIRAFAKNPLVGTGYSSITLATDNDYLRLLGEVGIVGFLSFMLLIAQLFLSLYPKGGKLSQYSPLEQAFLAGVAAALIGVLLNAVFVDVFESSKFAIIFWLMVGVAVGLIRSKNEES